jgi:hypothetical protein
MPANSKSAIVHTSSGDSPVLDGCAVVLTTANGEMGVDVSDTLPAAVDVAGAGVGVGVATKVARGALCICALGVATKVARGTFWICALGVATKAARGAFCACALRSVRLISTTPRPEVANSL